MKIKIKNLRIRTVIGVNGWERDRLQELVVNVEMTLDGSNAAESDNIEDTADYKEIKRKIVERAEKTSFQLLERLAGFLLDIVMEDEKVRKAVVEVDKPNVLRFADSVSVTLSRERQ